MLEHVTLYLLIFFIILLFNLVVAWRKQKKLEKLSKTRGPLSLPFIGSSYSLIGADLSETFRRLRDIKKQYGETTRFSFGSHFLIVTSSPIAIERTIGNKAFVDRIDLAKLILGDAFGNGLLINSGETWKLHRKLLSSLFHNNCLEKFLESFSRNATLLADNLSKIPKETTFDTYTYATLYTTDVLSETIMGTRLNAQLTMNTTFAESYNAILDMVGERTRRPWLYIDFLYRKTEICKKVQTCKDFLNGYIKDVLNEYKNQQKKMCCNEDGNQTIFDVLVESEDISEKEIVEECFNVFTAGSETTATAFSFVLVALGQHQDVQERMMEEQLSIFHDDINRSVTYEDLQKMVYLEQVGVFLSSNCTN